MTKNKVHVKIGGASYTIVTEDEAEYVEALADEISENMRAIINSNPSLSMTQAAVLVALDKAAAAAESKRQQQIMKKCLCIHHLLSWLPAV